MDGRNDWYVSVEDAQFSDTGSIEGFEIRLEGQTVFASGTPVAVDDRSTTTVYIVEEEDFVWSLVTWKKAREGLNATKLARRFPSIGAGKPVVAKALLRVKCWNCGTKGHLSKDCTKPRRPSGGRRCRTSSLADGASERWGLASRRDACCRSAEDLLANC